MQNGYLALTDPSWYEFLASRNRVDEVNFWRPHGGQTFQAIRPGEPFFFKLRGPLKKIAGFGFFHRYELLPAWLAWDSFGEMNGAATFEAMLDQINRLREGPADPSGNFQIGCIMISAPIFFRPEEWVDPPSDWPPSGIQRGKTYALDSGEGNRIFRECMERATQSNRYWNIERVGEERPRYGEPVLIQPRLGQGIFTVEVRRAYKGACAITEEHSAPALDAAHIVPYGQGGEHRVDNGLLLRSDLHRLFDRGYVTVTPDYIFRVGERLRDEFHNGRSYYSLNGTRIRLPERPEDRPRREHLEWHAHTVFRG